jgi:hypothetical protein
MLKFLCCFLKKVSTFSSENKMGAENLGMVFSPSLQIKGSRKNSIPTPENPTPDELLAIQREAQKKSMESMKSLKTLNVIMTTLISEYKLLFETDPIRKKSVKKLDEEQISLILKETHLDQPLRSSSFEVKDLETEDFITQVQKNRRMRRNHTSSFIHQSIEKK